MAGHIYTRRGDEGDTSLADGARTRKDDPRVEACGALDETASAIGLARAAVTDTPLDLALAFMQQRLLTLASTLSGAGVESVAPLTAEPHPRHKTYFNVLINVSENTSSVRSSRSGVTET